MASTSATQPITTMSCDEDDIDLMFQSKIELGSPKASNVDLDVTWEILIPKLVANKNLWSTNHQTLTYWVVNESVLVNIYNPHMMRCFVCHLI
jgi:hypothetical protein